MVRCPVAPTAPDTGARGQRRGAVVVVAGTVVVVVDGATVVVGMATVDSSQTTVLLATLLPAAGV